MKSVWRKILQVLVIATVAFVWGFGNVETVFADPTGVTTSQSELNAIFKKYEQNKITNKKRFAKCGKLNYGGNDYRNISDSRVFELLTDGTKCKEYKDYCSKKKVYGAGDSRCVTYEKYYDSSGNLRSYYEGSTDGTATNVNNNSGSSSSSSGSSSSTSGYDSSADYSGGSNSRGCVETSLFGCVEVGDDGTGIFFILNIVLTVMTYGVGILATVGIVWAGYTYLTAKDDASKIQKAKERIVQVVIGLVIYSVMWTALQFILPGGLFGNGGGS